MLQELDIEGYAVVDRLRVSFQPGLNILTGETGSGKSIVIGSLAALFGARIGADVVRSGASKARVTGIFDLPCDEEALDMLARSGIDTGEGELIVERQVQASGRGRAYVNGSPVTLSLLRDLAPRLGDIHGQHEQQTLLSGAQQLRMLDVFAGTVADADMVRDVYRRWRDAGEGLEKLRGSEQERLRQLDLLRYQLDEIREVSPAQDEDRELEDERGRLANVESLRRTAFEAFGSLYESSDSAAARIKTASDALSSLVSVDSRLEGFGESLDSARSTVEDVALELSSYAEHLEADPARLEQVEERLAALEKLKRKYGPALEDVAAFARRSEEEVASLDGYEEQIEELEREFEETSDRYAGLSAKLSGQRRTASENLSSRMEGELAELALDKARFEVGIEPREGPGPSGADRVSFLFSANPGQPSRPLGQVASGGELSRVALSLKTCLETKAEASVDRRTAVFDEIDSGVGGSVAESIGRRLKRLASGSQVLCVTHLPQIARFADAHFHVSKSESDGSVTAAVAELSEPDRVTELARMLSGAEVTEAAIENARELLAAE